MAVIVNV